MRSSLPQRHQDLIYVDSGPTCHQGALPAGRWLQIKMFPQPSMLQSANLSVVWWGRCEDQEAINDLDPLTVCPHIADSTLD